MIAGGGSIHWSRRKRLDAKELKALLEEYPEAPSWVQLLPSLTEARRIMKLRRKAFPKTEPESDR